MTPQGPGRTCRCNHRMIRRGGVRGKESLQRPEMFKWVPDFPVQQESLKQSLSRAPEWMIKGASCMFIEESGDGQALLSLPLSPPLPLLGAPSRIFQVCLALFLPLSLLSSLAVSEGGWALVSAVCVCVWAWPDPLTSCSSKLPRPLCKLYLLHN